MLLQQNRFFSCCENEFSIDLSFIQVTPSEKEMNVLGDNWLVSEGKIAINNHEISVPRWQRIQKRPYSVALRKYVLYIRVGLV